MLKLFVVALVVAAVAADLDADWHKFKARYQKKYTPAEEPKRKSIWYDNRKFIAEHNKKYKNGMSSFYVGENKYADMTSSEFSSMMTGLPVGHDNIHEVSKIRLIQPPINLDYRKEGVVTPVQDQGECSAGWAFSATGAIEGMWALATGKLIKLSESNLIDCTIRNNGCGGGTVANAVLWAGNGIDTEESYPYTPERRDCMYHNGTSGISYRRASRITNSNEEELQSVLIQAGPVAITIDASHPSFHLYKGGVYDEPDCSSENVNHGVLLVGYGVDPIKGTDYWLVKNSFGLSWGEEGYILMVRNKNNQCGIATDICIPSLCRDYH